MTNWISSATRQFQQDNEIQMVFGKVRDFRTYLSSQRITSAISSVSHLCTASRDISTAAASWSNDFRMGVCSAGSECHIPDTVLTRSLKRPLDA